MRINDGYPFADLEIGAGYHGFCEIVWYIVLMVAVVCVFWIAPGLSTHVKEVRLPKHFLYVRKVFRIFAHTVFCILLSVREYLSLFPAL